MSEHGFLKLDEVLETHAWERDEKYDGWRHESNGRPDRRNAWVYQPAARALLYPEQDYQVDLQRINDTASLISWVFHVAGKTWAHENNVLADLVSSLQTIFGFDPPAGREDGCMVDLDQFEKCLGGPRRLWRPEAGRPDPAAG